MSIFSLLGFSLLTSHLACNSSQPLSYQRLPTRTVACENDGNPRYDGRFSLGVNGENLTYSWFGDEATWVTSHFVIRHYNKKGSFNGKEDAQDFFSSNNPLAWIYSDHDLNQYLTGDLYLYGSKEAPKSVIEYDSPGLQIKQELTPMRHNFKELNAYQHRPTLYQVKYVLTNTDSSRNRIGFQARLDPQLRHADNCLIEPFKHRKSVGKVINALEKVPDSISPKGRTLVRNNKWAQNYNGFRIHETKQVNRDATVGFIYTGNRRKDLQPGRIILGSWNQHKTQLWNKPSTPTEIDDSNLILEWDLTLEKGASQEIVYYYGWYFPSWGKRFFSGLVKPNSVQMVHQGSTDYLDDLYFALSQDTVWIGDSVRAEGCIDAKDADWR